MKDRSVLPESRHPKVEGRKRRRLPYLASAFLILLALSCVVIATMASLARAPLSLPSAGGYEEAEAAKGLHGESSGGIPGFRVHGEAVEALNMAPGDRVTSDFILENLSPDPIRVVVTSRLASDNGLCEALLVSLILARQDSSEESEIIYYGPLTALYRKPDRGLTLSVEGSERLIWSVYFPFENGNDYQAVQCQVDFVFEGQQT